MDLFEEISRKLDNTKVRVIEGDLPLGDWLFNGQAIVFVKEVVNGDSISENGEEGPREPEKIWVQLQDKVRVHPRKADESGLLMEFGQQMSPLYGTFLGAQVLGMFGAFAGFAAGTLVGRNEASFACELDDGRKFVATADYKIFRRIMQIAIKN